MKRITRRCAKPLALFIFALLLLPLPSGATEPVSISILTLDNRPPNNLLLKQIAAVAGIDLVVRFDPEAASTADLVSLNAAAAGSLVGSRTADPWTLDPPDVRPDALFHFAVPRVEPTVSDQQLAQRYSEIRVSLESPELQRTVLAAIETGDIYFTDETVASYCDRIRGWIDFLERARYDPDRLLITFDDNRPGPLSDGLKRIFSEFSNHVFDGTDEGMMLLLARALRERQEDAPISCAVVFSDPGGLLDVQPFESGVAIENFLIMCDWLGVRISPRLDLYEAWRPVIWLHTAADPAQIRDTAETLGDRTVIVADIALPNGGDPALIDSWRDGAPSGLIGYLGWNTSSNTLGSALALWAATDFAYEHTADPEGVRAATETFLWARLLDDYLYQRLIRSEMTGVAREAGYYPCDLTEEQAQSIAESITMRLLERWSALEEPFSVPLRIVDTSEHTRFRIELPWNRLFEVSLYPSDDRGVLPTINPEK